MLLYSRERQFECTVQDKKHSVCSLSIGVSVYFLRSIFQHDVFIYNIICKIIFIFL